MNEGNLRNLLNHFSADYTNLKKYIKYTDINRNHSMNRGHRSNILKNKANKLTINNLLKAQGSKQKKNKNKNKNTIESGF